MKHRVASLLNLLLVAPLLLVACNGEAGPLDPTPVLGEYTLYQINGVSAPIVVYQDARGQHEVIGGSMTLRGDRSYTETADVRIVPPSGSPAPPVTNSVTGSFRLTSRGVEFLTQQGNLFVGTLVGDTLTYTVPGYRVSYVR